MPPEYAEFERLLSLMVETGASDLFLSAGSTPKIRLKGEVVSLEDARGMSQQSLSTLLRHVLRPTQAEAFERDGDLDFGLGIKGGGRFRINAHRQRGLLGMVVRRVPAGSLEFDVLGLPEELRSFGNLTRGLILVTGATGSGKSTTIAALVHHINTTFAKHIVTIEDPVEFLHENIRSLVTQREVGGDTQSFSSALHHVLRESPDVIVIGELRDVDAVRVAIGAAMSGHLVIASLHTMDSVQTLQRIVSFYPEHLRDQVKLDLSMCLEAVVSQRLVPRADAGGMVAVVEVLSGSPAVRKLLREGRIEDLYELLQNGSGMRSFNRALLELLEKKLITLETGMAYAPNPEEFRMNTQGMERSSAQVFSELDALPNVGGLEMRALLHSASRHGASDIHLAAGSPPIFRVNGELRPLATQVLSAGDVRRLLFSLLNHAQRGAFEVSRELDFALSVSSQTRFRVNAYFQRNTTAVSMRLVPNEIPSIEALGLPEAVQRLAGALQGLVLVTGPTGSGKSTTLAALVEFINSSRSCRILTIEDPIEFVHRNKLSHIEQREVGADTKSFATALKYALRQDPDVILVGEMRDLETIQAALTAAETGHLVLATLHTNDAPQAVDRIVDVFPPHQQDQVRTQLAAALLGIVSQRLLRKSDGSGRVAAFEVLIANSAVRTIVREGKTHQLLGTMEIGGREGMQTLDRSVEALFRGGRISREEAMSYLRSPSELQDLPLPPESSGSPRG